MKLQAITNDTLQILEAGGYEHEGRRIEIGSAVARACAGARAHSPAELADVVAGVAAVEGTSRGEVTVTAESTAACARRLVGEGARVACLNFASAKNPGGGFLGSARAQEEQLCRASGLYPTLLTQRVYYDANRANRDARYTDWAITSPDVPVFRDDAMARLARPFEASFITMPAPNAGALKDADPADLSSIFVRRIEAVLALGVELGATRFVAGAWGCGAFRNDPELVARAFVDVLSRGWAKRFDQVVFAIYALRSGDRNFEVFSRHL
jgi:uncharacterized protein (TIGR02452 family)